MVTAPSLDWLQTLSDGTRVRLLRLLEQSELSVSELCTIVQLPQSTVSRHLKVLAADHWIVHRREGTNHLYRVDGSGWPESRQGLWQWVRQQGDTPTSLLDQQRLARVMVERSRSEAFFSSSADQWDRLRVELFGNQLDAFILAASMPGDAVVGELGCGSAPLSQLVAPFVKEVIAIDNSSSMIAAARQRLAGLGNVRLEQSSLSELPLKARQLDGAWMVLVLPYLSDPAEVLREAGRVLKPSSPLVIVDLLPHDRSSYRQEMGHVRLGTSRDELESWLALSPLRLVHYRLLPPDPAAKGPALFVAVLKH
jgi:ubiquinone/menaquinone biosynthesis C-methylase UbiE/DNA-binding transcriptional ArsR family regulator